MLSRAYPLLVFLLTVPTQTSESDKEHKLANFNCPEGHTIIVSRAKNDELKSLDGYYSFMDGERYKGQKEQWCEKDGVKNGPFLLYGPNGQTLERAFYQSGKYHGKRTIETNKAILERFYVNGVEDVLAFRILMKSDYRAILDFKDCIKHKSTIPGKNGDAEYYMLGKAKDHSCEVTIQWKDEKGFSRFGTCRFNKQIKSVEINDFSGFPPQEEQLSKFCKYK